MVEIFPCPDLGGPRLGNRPGLLDRAELGRPTFLFVGLPTGWSPR